MPTKTPNWANENWEKDKPVTFKIPDHMFEAMEELISEGFYKNRSEIIRDAIDQLLREELEDYE